jgi:hypothetical protein
VVYTLGGTEQGNYDAPSNYVVTDGAINRRNLTVTATASNKVFDNTTTAIVQLSSNKLTNDVVNLSYTSADFIDQNVGIGKLVTITGISISGADAGNYNLTNTSTTAYANISISNTTTELITSAGKLRFMDNITLTANVKPQSGYGISGQVQFKINGANWGPAITVVPIPGDAMKRVQATLIKQVDKLPSNTDYIITAEFTSSSTNFNSSNSTSSKTLHVDPRNADPYYAKGYYTGDLFAWTNASSSSKATVTLTAMVKDMNIPQGDVRAAKVTFYYVNGTTLTPIPSAKDVPVGLVDVNDGSVGFASAIVQFDIGSANSQDYNIAVGVTGAYYNDPKASCAQKLITISKPIPGGFIVGGGDLNNGNSSGYIKGKADQTTDYHFDIQYTKSGTNPKGKATITIRSMYKLDGTLDNTPHTYVIQSNAIASLVVQQLSSSAGGGAVGDFSAKANLYEQMPDLSLVQYEGGAILQMQTFQNCGIQELAITFFRKAGGIWFSSNWVNTKTERKPVSQGSVISVAGGNVNCAQTMPVITNTRSSEIMVEQHTVIVLSAKAYPNPTTSQFNVKLESSNTIDPISIIVYGVNGKVVEQKQKLTAGQTIQLGALYRPGIYILDVIQGTQHKQLKLVKIPD